MEIRKTLFLWFVGTAFLWAQSGWQAPPEADKLVNPFKGDPASVKLGEKIYKTMCASCHGKTGKGDVPAMQAMNPKPTNLTSDAVQQQTDGAIFWKISEGRGLMAAYKNMLSEEERWALVNYIRTLAPQPDGNQTPSVKQDKEKQEKTTAPKAKTSGSSKKEARQEAIDLLGSKRPSPVDAFPFTILINAKTTHFFNPETFGFIIQHRFGPVKLDEGLIINFLGLDLAANVRFAFEIPWGERFYAEIGRTRYGKIYDLGAKYLIMQQLSDDSNPVSIALYGNIAVNTDQAPVYSENATFVDGTPFVFKWYHRLYYDTQIIVARKFSRKLSAQVTAEFIWRNLAPPPMQTQGKGEIPERNYIFAFPLAMHYKLGYLSAISLEVMPNTHPKTFPFALAYEIASSGNHVFQITLSNTDRILPQMIFTNPTFRPGKEGLLLGFNLIRYF